MGIFLRFNCPFCGYSEEEIPVGCGRDASISLKLFQCESCKSIGSAWVKNEEQARCSFCYDREIEQLPEDITSLKCPKCGELAAIQAKEGEWQ